MARNVESETTQVVRPERTGEVKVWSYVLEGSPDNVRNPEWAKQASKRILAYMKALGEYISVGVRTHRTVPYTDSPYMVTITTVAK